GPTSPQTVHSGNWRPGQSLSGTDGFVRTYWSRFIATRDRPNVDLITGTLRGNCRETHVERAQSRHRLHRWPHLPFTKTAGFGTPARRRRGPRPDTGQPHLVHR